VRVCVCVCVCVSVLVYCRCTMSTLCLLGEVEGSPYISQRTNSLFPCLGLFNVVQGLGQSIHGDQSVLGHI